MQVRHQKVKDKSKRLQATRGLQANEGPRSACNRSADELMARLQGCTDLNALLLLQPIVEEAFPALLRTPGVDSYG